MLFFKTESLWLTGTAIGFVTLAISAGIVAGRERAKQRAVAEAAAAAMGAEARVKQETIAESIAPEQCEVWEAEAQARQEAIELEVRAKQAAIEANARAEREAMEAEARKEAMRAKIARVNSFVAYVRGNIGRGLVIDSNIWMNEKYEVFFTVLGQAAAKEGKPIIVYASQFDEICNIKRKSKYNDDKDRRARLAIGRIEKFQKEGLLRIDLKSFVTNVNAYADPVIIRQLVALAKEGETIWFISDDKELRIRVREHLMQIGTGSYIIEDSDALIEQCNEAIESSNTFKSAEPPVEDGIPAHA